MDDPCRLGHIRLATPGKAPSRRNLQLQVEARFVVGKTYEHKDQFLIKGDMWRKLGNMAIDSVGAGAPAYISSEAWSTVPLRDSQGSEEDIIFHVLTASCILSPVIYITL